MKPTHCPKCKADDIAEIAYGMPVFLKQGGTPHREGFWAKISRLLTGKARPTSVPMPVLDSKLQARLKLQEQYVSGGCIERSDSPQWHCRKCGHEWK